LPEQTDVVTGSFGYIGRYITDRLLAAGRQVKTITSHVEKPNPFGSKVAAFPYNFDRPDELVNTLRGVDRLFNTYWIRFDHDGMTFRQAVQNTKILFQCAAEAGVKKVVHVSVAHASVDSPLPYYSGKGRQEMALVESGLAHSIIRPTLVFGKEDILVNNIAWLIRNFPVFPIAGDGRYKLQPVYVGDLASIALEHGLSASSDTVDAIGPEIYTYEELVRTMASTIGKDVIFIHIPPWLSIILGRIIGAFLKDVILTKNELRGLMDEYLTSSENPNGPTLFSTWLEENKEAVGTRYSSELARHFRWSPTD
jgi:uncharacterized protein YbjT (DUF2867 family)